VNQNLAQVDAGLGLLVAVSIRLFMSPVPTSAREVRIVSPRSGESTGKVGFALLFVIGILDTATRMGFLLFLPFLMKTKGASLTSVGLALSLVFIGGAFGKAACAGSGHVLGCSQPYLRLRSVPLLPSCCSWCSLSVRA
jgi:MFS transporter, FSR family, fosmidomycin resistance protein